MNFSHFALNINDEKEITDFYFNILGMELIRSFEINSKLSADIFNIEGSFPVFHVRKDDVLIELFLKEHQKQSDFNHICINVDNRDEIISKAKDAGYKTTVINRDFSDLVFVYDKAGNPFELK